MQIHLTVSRRGEAPLRASLSESLVVGRDEACDLVLADPAVSKRHARIYRETERLLVEDLGSTNGSWLGEERIQGSAPLAIGQELRIGPFTLRAEAAPRPQETACPPVESEPPTEGDEVALAAILKELHGAVIERLDLRRMEVEELEPEELRRRTEDAIRHVLDDYRAAGKLPASLHRERWQKALADEVLGLGPLEELLADPTISEVMVNGPRQIYVEKEGRLRLSDKRFSSDQAVLAVIERIVSPVGRRIDEASPMVDARLRDGSRVHAVIPPLSLTGPCITIRKFQDDRLGVEELIRYGSLNEAMARFLELAVAARKNIVISGGTGSGKTTLLNVLTEFASDGERIVTVEDAAELRIRKPHWVRLEARPANLEGQGCISIRDLVKGCLRMRPDRIVVGECRGGEALDMLQAMNTGHDGSLTTVHANSPRDALSRLETLCLMAGMDLPARVIRQQIVSAVDLVVQQARFPDGARRITSIAEVVGMEGETITLQEIFRFRREGVGEDGRVLGRHEASGFVPTFCERMMEEGVEVDRSLFGGASV